jgi:SAM-dependent methyltransferase
LTGLDPPILRAWRTVIVFAHHVTDRTDRTDVTDRTDRTDVTDRTDRTDPLGPDRGRIGWRGSNMATICAILRCRRPLSQRFGRDCLLRTSRHSCMTMTDRTDWEPLMYVGLDRLIPPRHLWVQPHEPLIEYLRWTREFPLYLKLLCDLREDESVLEIGCNHGRTMIGLLGYLKSPGRYEGFDIMREHIDYANEAIQWNECSVGFQHADIFNGVYNPGGSVKASEFVFPYADVEFDVVYAASVITHMLPTDVAHYFTETSRVMKGGGRALFSVFVLDHFQGVGTAESEMYDYTTMLDGYDDVAIKNPTESELYISYSRDRLEQMAKDAGLTIQSILPGTWSRRFKRGVCEQDLMVLEKPGNDRATD